MKILERLVILAYVFLGPFSAFLLPPLLTAQYFEVSSSARNIERAVSATDATSRIRLIQSIRKFLKEHEGSPICTFNQRLVVTTKMLEMGEEITPSSVNQIKVQVFESKANLRRALPLDAIACKVGKHIEEGQLLSLEDLDIQDKARQEEAIRSLSDKPNPSQSELLLTKPIQTRPSNSTSSEQHAPRSLLSTSSLLPLVAIAAGVIILAVGQLGLLIEAFAENVLWGVGYLLIPGIGSFFAYRHWKSARKYTHLVVLGALFTGLGLSMVIVEASKTMSVSDWVMVATDGKRN